MHSPQFKTGAHEISEAAGEALRSANIDSNQLFVRHALGDWGDAPDWLRADNHRAAHAERDSHAIRSLYSLGDGSDLLVITSTDRTRTRLQLAAEFCEREVSILEGYGLWAAVYDNPNPLITVEQPIVESLLARIPIPQSALDVGTGTGRLARLIARRGAGSVLGVDATHEMLEQARRLAKDEGLTNVRFERLIVGEAPLPAADNTFDLLTSGLMLCHLPDVRGAIAECLRVVKPGGHLILTDFHPATQKFGWRTDFITPEGRMLLPNVRCTRDDYLEPLTEAGCTLLEVHDIGLDGKPYGSLDEESIAAKGLPPLALVVLARKW